VSAAHDARHRASREDYAARHLADDGAERAAVEVPGVECYPIGHMDDARRDPRPYAAARS
jgi:hypothetical protein